ncbi:DUF4236 domain-containing protein [Lautropia mirabilis]
MGLRFRKSVKLMPGIRVNFGKNGTSYSIGPRGANINLSKKGVYGNASIRGTGLSYRARLDGGTREVVEKEPFFKVFFGAIWTLFVAALKLIFILLIFMAILAAVISVSK